MEKNLINLFSHIQKGEMQYFDDFFNLTKKRIFYMSFSITKNEAASEDILQDTYIQFLKKKKKIKLDGNILSYLLEISKNLSLNYIKKSAKQDDIENYTISNEFEYQDSYLNLELVKQMKKILSDSEFEIVILHVINEMTNEEIASTMHKPLGTVLWSYRNAMQKLRREVKHV